MRKVTIADVAFRAGVSKGSVSFALNGRPGVSDSTRDRILRAAKELDFTPNHAARALSNSRSGMVGLVLARSPETLRADPFFPPFLAGVESVIAPSGCSLMLRFVGDEAAERSVYRELASTGRLDGVLLSDLRVRDPRPALLGRLQLPAVTLNRPSSGSAHPAVCLDDGPAVREAVRYLIGLGHRVIGHVGGPEIYLHARNRRRVWAQALEQAGLPVGPYREADFSAAGGSAATREMLGGPRRPTAVLYASDIMAVAGMSVAQSLGLQIPKDLSVVGFDDAELSAYVHPPLSTIRTDAYRWGRACAAALLDRVADPDAAPVDVILPAAELIVRESTGPPASQDVRLVL